MTDLRGLADERRSAADFLRIVTAPDTYMTVVAIEPTTGEPKGAVGSPWSQWPTPRRSSPTTAPTICTGR